MCNILRKASAALGTLVSFLAAVGLLAAVATSGVSAFGAAETPVLPDVPFESTAQIDPQTTVFLYLGDCADENLRRIYVEYNKNIAEPEKGTFQRYLDEECAEWEEILKAAAIEHDAALRKIETESKTPEEKAERVRLFYERLRVHASSPEEKRRLAIGFETERYWFKVRGPQPYERAKLRVAQERWRRIEREVWPKLEIDWENLNLDGARFDFRPEVSGVYDSTDEDAYPQFYSRQTSGGRDLCWGIPATLDQLSKTKSWREKTLRDAEFYRVFTGASFVGWTFENCRFLANQYAQGHTLFDCSDGRTGLPPELRAPGDLWRASGKIESYSDKIVGYDACDFTDATLDGCYFDASATIRFEQFAATRSFKEDKIKVNFGFELDGWDLRGKNAEKLRFGTDHWRKINDAKRANARPLAKSVDAEKAAVATEGKAATEDATETAVDESQRVVYLYLRNVENERAQELRRAWEERVVAAKAENGAKFETFKAEETAKDAENAYRRAWERVFDGTVETLASAKIDVDWESLNLDGATISDEARRCVNADEPEPYGDLECSLFYDEVGNVEIEYGIRATLAELRRTVNWREKRLSAATFERACFDESFAGWALTRCSFDAFLYGYLGGEERFKRWLSRNPNGCKRADFTDATLDRCSFDHNAAITFEQFATTRSYREDKICVDFDFPLGGWDFAGKNIGDMNRVTRSAVWGAQLREEFSGAFRGAKLDGARFDPSSKIYPKGLPEQVWRNSRACKEKDLSGATFPATLAGFQWKGAERTPPDYSDFDLTGATMLGVDAKLDGATIRGLKVVSSGRSAKRYGTYEDQLAYMREKEYGRLDGETLYATKSWRDKDLRDVEFNRFYDLTRVDFSGCDLSGAKFLLNKWESGERTPSPFWGGVDFTDAKIDGCRFEFYAPQGEPDWPTTAQIMSTETWKSGDLERLKTCVLPDEAQKIVDRRIFEASPEFAAKDFSGKEIKFRDMSGWDLSGLNLTGCKIVTRSLWNANLTGAILDGATLHQMPDYEACATTESLLRQPFLNLEQLAETDNYRRKSFRGLKIDGSVRDGNFSCAGLDWTGAELEGVGFVKSVWEKRDFTDAEIADSSIVKRLTKAQIVATKTFKEGRIDFDNFDTYVDYGDEKFAAELRAEYERLQTEKAGSVETVENAEKTTEAEVSRLDETSPKTSEGNDDAKFDPLGRLERVKPDFIWSPTKTRWALRLPTAWPREVWETSERLKNKDLSECRFSRRLNGGYFVGFDLTDAVVEDGPGFAMKDATIRGLWILGSRDETKWETLPLDDLYSTKSWKEKDLRGVWFNRFFDLRGADFSGCDLRGAAFETTLKDVDFSGADLRGAKFVVPGTLYEYNNNKFDGAIFDATTDGIAWEFLKERAKDDGGPIDQEANRRIERDCGFVWKDGAYEPKETRSVATKTGVREAPYFEFTASYDRAIEYWQKTKAFKNKDLSGCNFPSSLNGGDLSGFNLTDAVVRRVLEKPFEFRGATIRGLQIVDARTENVDARARYQSWLNAGAQGLESPEVWGAIKADDLAATKSWEIKDLREIRFNEYFDLRGADFSDCDLRGACFAKSLENVKFANAKIDGCQFAKEAFEPDAEATLDALAQTETWQDLERLKTVEFAPEIRALVESRLKDETRRSTSETEETPETGNAAEAAKAQPSETDENAASRVFYLYETASQNGANEPNWETLSLDGATISEYSTEIFDDDVGEETGVPATLEQLRRTKTWREKTAREVVFNASLAGESFVDWTFERCEFGGRWNGATRCDFSGCDFADATFDDVYFGAPAITFEQFAASRSFKEDKIVAEFTFPLVGWDFAGKNVSNIEVPSWDGAKLDGARLDPPRTTNRWAWGQAAVGLDKGPRDAAPRWPKVVPESLWRETEAFKNKDLSGTFFWPSTNGGDFAGFDLTDAFLLDGPGKGFNLDGATIRGFKIRERRDVTKRAFLGAIPASAIYRTKSWQDKDLRGVCFGVYFNLKDADFSGCDLRGAVFTTPIDGADFTGADLRGAKFSGRAFYDSFEDKPLKKPEFGKKGANFSGADLRGADFRNADGAARRSNFDGAKIDETTLGLAEQLAKKEETQRKLEQRVKSPSNGAVAKLERDAASEKEAFGKGRVVTRLGERSATFVANELTNAASDRRWRDTEAFKNKRLSGACFATSLNAGDFSGFDLTGAVARRVEGKPFDLRGATIRGLWVVDAEEENAEIRRRARESGKDETSPERPTPDARGTIKPTDLIATKSWAIKDLREIWFNRFFDLRGADFLLIDLRGAVFETSLEGAYLQGAKIDGCKFSRRAFGANVDATISALTQTETWRDLERMKTVEFSPSIRERVERRLGGETKRPAVESDWGDADWEDEENADANADDASDRFRAPGDFSTFAFTCEEPKFEARRPVSVYRALSDADWVGSKYFVDKCLRSVAFEAWLGGGDFSGFDLTGAAILDGVYEDFRIDGATIRGLWILGAEKPENRIWLGSISPDELRVTQSWKIKDLRGVCFNEFFDLRGVDFAGCDLSETLWTTALQGVKFGGCDLNGAFFAVGVDADADVLADAEIENCVFSARKPTFEQLTQTRTFRDGRLDYDAFDDAERLRAEFERQQAENAAENSESAATK